MSVYEAYALAAPAVSWRGEVASRLIDILGRRAGSALKDGATQLGEQFDRFVKMVEESLTNAVPVDRIKSALVSVLAAVKKRAQDEPALAERDLELTALLERVRRHSDGIESYSKHLFYVEIPSIEI